MALGHSLDGILCTQKGTQHIDFEYSPRRVYVQVFDTGPATIDTGIVYQTLNRAKVLFYLVKHRRHLGLNRDVGLHCHSHTT